MADSWQSLIAGPESLTGKTIAHYELRAASALNHPGSARFTNSGTTWPGRIFVMELLDGESLEQAIARGNLDVSAVLCIGIEMADALDAAHTDAICRRTARAADFLVSKGRALHNLLAVA